MRSRDVADGDVLELIVRAFSTRAGRETLDYLVRTGNSMQDLQDEIRTAANEISSVTEEIGDELMDTSNVAHAALEVAKDAAERVGALESVVSNVEE